MLFIVVSLALRLELRGREGSSKHDRWNFLPGSKAPLANGSEPFHGCNSVVAGGLMLVLGMGPSVADHFPPNNQPCSHPGPCPRLTLRPTPAHWIRAGIQIQEVFCIFSKFTFKDVVWYSSVLVISVLTIFHKIHKMWEVKDATFL